MGQKEPELKRPCPRCGKDQIGTLAIAFDPDTGIYWHADGSGDNCQPQPPVAQVEVYRKALEHTELLLETYVRVARHKKTETFILETEVLERWLTSIQQALLTSKPEPVCPKCLALSEAGGLDPCDEHKPEPVAQNMEYCSCGHNVSYHSEEAEGETVVMCSGVGLFCLECSKNVQRPNQ